MKIEFVNRGLLNIIEPLKIREEEIETIRIGESMFIITLKSGVIATMDYKLKNNDDWEKLVNEIQEHIQNNDYDWITEHFI